MSLLSARRIPCWQIAWSKASCEEISVLLSVILSLTLLLCSSAERHTPPHVRELLVAESGLNDGFGKATPFFHTR